MDLSSPYPEKESTPGLRGYVHSKGGWEIPFSPPCFPSPCYLPALSILGLFVALSPGALGAVGRRAGRWLLQVTEPRNMLQDAQMSRKSAFTAESCREDLQPP